MCTQLTPKKAMYIMVRVVEYVIHRLSMDNHKRLEWSWKYMQQI